MFDWCDTLVGCMRVVVNIVCKDAAQFCELFRKFVSWPNKYAKFPVKFKPDMDSYGEYMKNKMEEE